MITTTIAAGKLIAYGTCLGIGFWVSKKLTNKVDEVLLKYDKRKLKQLEEEMNLCP